MNNKKKQNIALELTQIQLTNQISPSVCVLYAAAGYTWMDFCCPRGCPTTERPEKAFYCSTLL